MADVHSLNAERAARAGDNTMLSPLDCLEDAAGEIRRGKNVCDKAIVLTVDTSDERFVVAWYAANIKASEMLAALECMKARVLGMMGYVNGPDTES